MLSDEQLSELEQIVKRYRQAGGYDRNAMQAVLIAHVPALLETVRELQKQLAEAVVCKEAS